eukprot:gene5889-6130_t
MEHSKERHAKGMQEEVVVEHEPIPQGHHFAAPEVEEWKPHPYEGEGLHRRESLKGDLPEEKQQEQAQQ